MKGRKARVTRGAGCRCSLIELLEDRAIPSVLSPSNPVHFAIPGRSQDVSRVRPSAVESSPGRTVVADNGNHEFAIESSTNHDVNPSFQDSEPVDESDPTLPSAPALAPDNNAFSAVMTDELEIGDGAGLDAEDSANATSWSSSDPRGEGSPTSDAFDSVTRTSVRAIRGQQAPRFLAGRTWLLTAAIVHPKGIIGGSDGVDDGGTESRIRLQVPRIAGTVAAAGDRPGAQQARSSGWADLLERAGSPNWSSLDGALRQFLSRRFGGDSAPTDPGVENPNWVRWLAVLVPTLAAAKAVAGRGWKYRRVSLRAEATGREPDSTAGSPGPWPLGPL